MQPRRQRGDHWCAWLKRAVANKHPVFLAAAVLLPGAIPDHPEDQQVDETRCVTTDKPPFTPLLQWGEHGLEGSPHHVHEFRLPVPGRLLRHHLPCLAQDGGDQAPCCACCSATRWPITIARPAAAGEDSCCCSLVILPFWISGSCCASTPGSGLLRQSRRDQRLPDLGNRRDPHADPDALQRLRGLPRASCIRTCRS